MNKHTPGPWTMEREFNEAGTIAEAKGRVSTQIMNKDGWQVGVWIDAEHDGHCPHAELIAAAPDLLVALQDCITDHGAMAERSHEYALRRLAAINELARAAIAKATGVQQ